eukprot:CAMPEP_0197526264 /NCGR_PEP_ID=MMETSP1318-20131121/17084_1 /TAXON_ID=552666 /ORGANISM="Partenskyella glossopodia, Strain RCC365" /LENGTH=350 /DNA_ID=CAMNT_0043080359 /DNA_START=93 /DNA_END=1145 /DNA_ORIENTATION=+
MSSHTKEEFARYVWDNEILLRENAMLESYLERERKQISLKELVDGVEPVQRQLSGHRGSKSSRKIKDQTKITLKQKIFITEQEIKSREKQLKDIEETYQRESINYKAMIKETEMRITEIKREAYEFKRVVLGKGVDPHSGKTRAENIVKYYDDKIKEKDTLVEKLLQKNVVLKREIKSMEKQLSNRDNSGEMLSSIDFLQLKIENKSFNAKIDEKNKALLKLKVSAAQMGQELTEKRSELASHLKGAVTLRKRISEAETREKQLEADLIKTRAHVTKIKKTVKRLKISQQVSDMPKIEDYVKQKEIEYNLRRKIKQMEKKVELATVYARRARNNASKRAEENSKRTAQLS